MSSLQEKQRREANYAAQIDAAIQNHDLDGMLNTFRQASLDLRRNEVTPMIEGHLAKVRKEMYGLGYKYDALEYFVDTGKLPSYSSSGNGSNRGTTSPKAPQPTTKKDNDGTPTWLKILFAIIVLVFMSKGCE